MYLSLLQYLKCPQCAHDTLELSAKTQNGEEILAGDLRCPACKRIFPIIDSVPNFLPEAETRKPWRKAWSYKWDHVAKDVRYSEEGDEDFEIKMNYSGQFSGDLSGKLALDAGCGSGQDTARIARLGAEVIAVDQSTGVYQAHKFNAGKNYRSPVHFIRADIFHLPLKDDIFDLIYSNGVLHHTPDTKQAFDSVAPLLKQGGDIAIWVYDRTQYWRLFETFWRPVLSRLPHPLLSLFLHSVNRPWHAIYRYRKFMMKTVNPWPDNTVAEFLFDLFSGGHVLYLLTDYHLHLAHRVEDHYIRYHHAFDGYAPRYAWGHNESELFDWFSYHGIRTTAISPVRCGLTGKKDNTCAVSAESSP